MSSLARTAAASVGLGIAAFAGSEAISNGFRGEQYQRYELCRDKLSDEQHLMMQSDVFERFANCPELYDPSPGDAARIFQLAESTIILIRVPSREQFVSYHEPNKERNKRNDRVRALFAALFGGSLGFATSNRAPQEGGEYKTKFNVG